MAITIVQEPDDITPAFNQCAYVVDSDQTHQTGFRFYAIINDASGTQISRQEFTAPPTQTNGYIDIHRIVSNLVSFDFGKDIDGCATMGNSIAKIEVEFGEIYGGVEQAVSATSEIIVTNMGLDSYEYLNYAPASYNNIFLSNTTEIKSTSLAWGAFMQTNLTKLTRIRYEFKNSSNILISTLLIKNDFDPFTDDAANKIQFPVGINLEDIIPDNIVSGLAQLPTFASYIDITLNNGSTDIVSKRISLIDRLDLQGCIKSDYEIYYLNDSGVFDTLVMAKGYKVNKSLERQQASRIKSSMTSSTTYGYSSDSAMRVNNRISYQSKWMLNSDWITEEQSALYFTAISSPVIYLNDNGTIKRVNCAESSYQEKTERFDRLFHFEINLEESQKQERQWVN